MKIISRIAIAGVLVAAPAVGFLGGGVAGASPAAPHATVTASATASAASPSTIAGCKGKIIHWVSWKSGKTSYKPGANVAVRGVVVNCTSKKQTFKFYATITAPGCGSANANKVSQTLKAKAEGRLTTTLGDISNCPGTWKVKGNIQQNNKIIASEVATFKVS